MNEEKEKDPKIEAAMREAANILMKAEVENLLVICTKGPEAYRMTTMQTDEDILKYVVHHLISSNESEKHELSYYTTTPNGLRKLNDDAN